MARNDEATSPALTLAQAVRLTKALGHPARLRMLAMLRGGDLCVCQLTAVLGLAVSTVSGHLAELRRAGLVREAKEGRWVRYGLSREEAPAALAGRVLDLVAGDGAVRDDQELATELRRRSPEALCEAGLDLAALGLGTGAGDDSRAESRP